MSRRSASPKARHIKKILPAFLLSITTSHAAMAAGLGFAPGPTGWDYYSSQNLLIGATMSLQQSANYGQGTTLATIDTGITTGWAGFGGLNISSYSCLNNACGTAAANSDDNGHGTFVASEMVGGAMFSSGNGMLGVAPFANLVSVKVLNSQGSGSSTDVANGIRYAVDHGAKILNLSLGPTGSTASQVSFYNSLASAIDYAASKNAIIVFAGGNSGQLFAGGASIGVARMTTTNLFTDAALQRLFFVGATNSKEQVTSYSNLPGSAGFYSNSGKFYAYKSMWLMADGGGISGNSCVDCIVGAPNVVNANYLALDAGTSMAAPQGAGAAALLAARWPVLLTNGTIPQLLEQTATDLGSKGTDSIYGDGFINLAQAFQPVGTLSVNTKSGSTVVTQTGGSMLSGGALGSMPKLGTILSNYTAFDSYQRDFTVNLSGLIATKSSSSPASQTMVAPKATGGQTHFADGSSLSFGNVTTDDSPAIDHPGKANGSWFTSFTDSSGSTMAAGVGFPASASFAGAMWGDDGAVAGQIYALGASDALLNLAEGGNFVAFGTNLSNDTRMAFSWGETQANALPGVDLTKPIAKSLSTGVTSNLMDNWKAGVTFGLLNEQNGLLGTTYMTGPVSLGENHQSMSMGVSSAFALGDKRDLVFDAAIVRSDGAQLSDSIISDISPLYARTMGAALVQRDAVRAGDNLSFSLRAPLRVFSGSASVATTSVDGNGLASTSNQRVSLTPNGTEMDLTLGYAAPINENLSWNMSFDARHDADNIHGSNDADFLVGAKLTF